jgi:peptide/nickel transport system substrate-binding protein
MIAAVVAARDRDDFVAAVRALDRLLLSGFYIVPMFYAKDQWIAYSSSLGHPDKTPLFGATLESWWRAKQ